jgi:nucleoside 2-deoxyribosyltransferase
MSDKKTPSIYLAGPDVFLPNAVGFAATKKAACAAHGFFGVFPLDAELTFPAAMSARERGCAISAANESLMRGCDLLIANCTPFRGISMDVGTAFEVGFMRALGRPVLGYANTGFSYAERAAAYRRFNQRAPGDGDVDATEIERFDMTENLMIEAAIVSSGSQLFCTTVSDTDQRLTDLAGFHLCLRDAVRLMA